MKRLTSIYWRWRIWWEPESLLDPLTPMWAIDEELRRRGHDPEVVARILDQVPAERHRAAEFRKRWAAVDARGGWRR